MNIQIFGFKKCKDTQKAMRFFKERGIKFHFVDLEEKQLSKGELNNITKSIPVDSLIDKESNEFKKGNYKYIQYDPYELVLKKPLIIKTPVVRNDNLSTAGYCPEVWKNWIK